MKTRQEIVERMAQVRADIEELVRVEGNLDEAQTATWDARNEEWTTLDAELTALDERDARLAAIRGRDLTIATGDGAAGAGTAKSVQVQRGAPEDVFDLDTLPHFRSAGYGTAVRDRAMRAMDTWSERDIKPEWKESIERLIDPRSRNGQRIGEYLLRTGSPEYFSAFCKVLANPTMGIAMLEPEEMRAMQRAALAEGTTTTGGFAVPPMLDPTLILQNVGVTNPFRQLATVKSITTQTWKGVTSAGVTAEWTAEATEAADASPTIGQPVITPHRADAYVQASFEMIEDTSIATDLAMLFADARDRLEGAAFATGSGDGSNQPNGVITAVSAVTASRVAATTTSTFGAPDVFDVDNALPPRYRPGASWAANKAIYNLARQFAIGSGGMTGSFWVDFGGGRPSSLIGYPVFEASAMANNLGTQSTATHNVLVLGDFKQGYYIVDRIGMSVAYNPLVVGASGRRPTGEVGWFAFWRVGGGCVNTDAFRLLQV